MQVVDNFRLMQIKSGGKIVVLHEFTKLLAAGSATQIKDLLTGSVFLAARQVEYLQQIERNQPNQISLSFSFVQNLEMGLFYGIKNALTVQGFKATDRKQRRLIFLGYSRYLYVIRLQHDSRIGRRH